jgi:hypothetical protein
MIANQTETTVIEALYSQWQTDPATRQNLNVIAADYVEDIPLLTDAIQMNEAKFGTPPAPAITGPTAGNRSGRPGAPPPGRAGR